VSDIASTLAQPTPRSGVGEAVWARAALRMLSPLLIILSLLPSVAWVRLNSGVWPWDQAWYGQLSVDLFDVLANNPGHWFSALADAFAIKAPALAWLGEFLVPLGRALGAVDATLMLIPLAASLLALLVLYRALVSLTDGSELSALLGTLAVASAPLFVGMAHQYLVEPLQTLAVAWFVLIAVEAPRAPRAYTAVHLVAASAFALLVKVSSPLYCLLPGLLALRYVALPGALDGQRPTLRVSTWNWVLGSLAAFLATIGTLVWYVHNWHYILQQVELDRAGPVANLYGTPAPMIQKLPFWINAMQESFFLPAVGGLFVIVGVLGIAVFAVRRAHHGRATYGFVCLVAALAELLIVLLSFASATPEETRYLVPATVYLGVVVAWAVNQLRSRIVFLLVGVTILVQLVVVNAQALGASPTRPDVSPWLLAPTSGAQQDALINRIVAETCQSTGLNRYTIVGVEIASFNANTLAYYASKQRAQRGGGDCYYTALGFGQTDVDTAWKRVVDLNTLYFVSLDHTRFPYGVDAFNGPNELVLERIRTDPTYMEVPQDGVTEGVLVYRQR
jgi:hypothetical protein